jgi:cold shock CspA family protein
MSRNTNTNSRDQPFGGRRSGASDGGGGSGGGGGSYHSRDSRGGGGGYGRYNSQRSGGEDRDSHSHGSFGGGSSSHGGSHTSSHRRGGGDGGGGSGSGRRDRNDRDSSYRDNRDREPSEWSEGLIIALLENFGFINCADRQEDVFFHYAELTGNSLASTPDDLREGQVVRFGFRGSGGGRDRDSSGDGTAKKEKAIRVEVMPEGTQIQWDTPVAGESNAEAGSMRGNIIKVAPSSLSRRDNNSRNSSGQALSMSCGTIQLCPQNKVKGGPISGSGSGNEDVVYFKQEDVTGGGIKLGEQDLVEFHLMRNRKTKSLFAKSLKLIQSEKERLRQEREERLLLGATKEHGVVLSLHSNGGYIRSTRHDLPIPFSYNAVELSTTEEEGPDVDADAADDDDKNTTLHKGQLVEFLVVYDDMGLAASSTSIRDKKAKDGDEVPLPLRRLEKVKLSARQVTFSRGGQDKETENAGQDTSPLRYTTIAHDVTGIIVTPPSFSSNVSWQTSPVSDLDLRGSYGTPGVLRLHTPLEIKVKHKDSNGDGDGETVRVVRDVELYPEDCPGGVRGAGATAESSGSTHNNKTQQQQQQQQGQSWDTWMMRGDSICLDVVQESFAFKTVAMGGGGGRNNNNDLATLVEEDWTRIRAHPPRKIKISTLDNKDKVHNNVGDVTGEPENANAAKESDGSSSSNGSSDAVEWKQLFAGGRFEGVVSSIKSESGFGFIKLLDRPNTDAYFRLTEVLPDHAISVGGLILDDHNDNGNDAPTPVSHQRQIRIGCTVSFDLRAVTNQAGDSSHASSNSNSRRSSDKSKQNQQQQQQPQESLRAGRILVLAPPAKANDSISIPGMRYSATSTNYWHSPKAHFCLRKDVYAKITKRHGNGGGMVEILYDDNNNNNNNGSSNGNTSSNKGGTDVNVNAPEKSSKSKEAEAEGSSGEGKGSQSQLQEQLRTVKDNIYSRTPAERYRDFTNLLDSFCSSTSEDGASSLSLLSYKYPLDEIVFPDQLPRTETAMLVHLAENHRDGGVLTVDFLPTTSSASGDTKEDDTDTAADWGNGRIRICHAVPRGSSGGKLSEDGANESDSGHATGTPVVVAKKSQSRSKHSKPPKPIASIRFDAGALADAKQYRGPTEGDIILLDAYQSRPTGNFEAMNIRLVERAVVLERSSASVLNDILASGEEEVGFVTEVVAARQFGFISVLDCSNVSGNGDTSISGDMIVPVKDKMFFHFKDLVGSGGNNSGSANKIRKGDEVKFKVVTSVVANSKLGAGEKKTAVNVVRLRNGTLPKIPTSTTRSDNNAVGGASSNVNAADACQGYVLMEPSHTTLANTPSHKVSRDQSRSNGNGNVAGGGSDSQPAAIGAATVPGSRWARASAQEEKQLHHSESTINEDGCVLLLSDPKGLFSAKGNNDDENYGPSKEETSGGDHVKKDAADLSMGETLVAAEDDDNKIKGKDTGDGKSDQQNPTEEGPKRMRYSKSDVVGGSSTNNASPGRFKKHVDNKTIGPRRGDLVSFVRSTRNGGVKEMRVVKRNAAVLVRGTLTHIDFGNETATFVVDAKESSTNGSTPGQAQVAKTFDIKLYEVVSCKIKVLKENEPVEGILHDGMLYGISRTKDLYIVSKVMATKQISGMGMGMGQAKERPRLNLTVKKELQGMGGKIIAQSGMAKGPDGTNGFPEAWTPRPSWYALGERQEWAFEPPSDS